MTDEASTDDENPLIHEVTVLDLRIETCTGASCETPDASVVAILRYQDTHGYNFCCAGCFLKTMDRIDAEGGTIGGLPVRTNFTQDYVTRRRREH